MRHASSSRWPAQPAGFAALLVLTAAGAVIGWRADGLVGTAVGAGAGVLVSVLLALAVDRLTAVLVTRPGRTAASRTARTRPNHRRT